MNDTTPFQGFGLTKSESKIAYALYEARGATAPIDYLLKKLYPSSMISDMKLVLHDRKQDTWVLSGTRTLRVFISKIRRKLNIEVTSEYNGGYYLKEEALQHLDQLLVLHTGEYGHGSEEALMVESEEAQR